MEYSQSLKYFLATRLRSHFFLHLFVILVLICGFLLFNAVKSTTNLNEVQAYQSSDVPPQPTSRADRFGIYNWNINDWALPFDGSIDRLNWGADQVAEMGARTIRVALTWQDIYRLGFPRSADLRQIAQTPAYDKLFRDPRFPTIMLTAFSQGDMRSNWADGFTQDEYNAERDEIKRLGEYLLSNPAFANKTFIIFNWEGDNALYLVSNKRSGWDYYLNWIRSRTEGVKLARQSFPSSNVRLFSGLEFNLVSNPLTQKPCGAPVDDPIRNNPLGNRCVIDYVAPQVDVDYYSYSAWQTVYSKYENPNDSLKQRFKNDLGFALAKVKERRPEITERNFIVGEYGFERSLYGECNAANHVNEMFDAFDGPDAFQASYVIFWQIGDNAAYYGFESELFGLYRTRDHKLNLTLLGDTYRKRIAGQAVEKYSGCPSIRRHPAPGVLTHDGTTDFRLNPDSILSIYVQGADLPFSNSGNMVHFDQLNKYSQLPAENPELFYESPTQINISMPAGRRPGGAKIYVTDSRGIDSNAFGILIRCPDCPVIDNKCGVLDAQYQTRSILSGQTISIYGQSFSPSGNTVIVEQREPQQVAQRTTIPRSNIRQESTTQLKVELPNDLFPDRQTILYVVNAQGRESNNIAFSISESCVDCEPRLRPCQGVMNEAGGEFFAGTVATIFGRFPSGSNKVIIEQVDQQSRVYNHTLKQGAAAWSETDEYIRFALPANLFAGRALIYVIDSQGRESTAEEIKISSTTVTNVSAANYQGPILAAESIVAAFGNAMATDTHSALSTPLPTELGGTRMIIKDSMGTERDAPLFYVSPTQINFQIPEGTANGRASATVLSGYGALSFGTIDVVNVAPGLFSADSTGKGIAAAVAVRLKTDGTLIYETIVGFDQQLNRFVSFPIDLGPAEDKVFLALFGTGIKARSSLSAVTATIGGISCEVVYAGPQGVFVGQDQINVLLPRSLAGKGDVDIRVSVDQRDANIVSAKMK